MTKELKQLVFFIVDEENSELVLRGTEDALKEAATIIHQYFSESFVGKKNISNNHAVALLHGGKVSKVAQLAIEFSIHLSADKEEGTLVAQGPEANVKEALSAVDRFLSESSRAADLCVTIRIDTPQHAQALIGRGGSRIQELRRQTGCTIKVDTKTPSVTISASEPETLAKAKGMIDKVLSEEPGELVVVDIPKKYIPAFIGRKGVHLNDFCKTHAVEVKVDNVRAEVRISGSTEHVEDALKAVDEWMASRGDRLQERDTVDKTMQSSTLMLESTEGWILSSILGKGGSRIQSLRRTTGCKIIVDSTEFRISVSAENPERMSRGLESVQAAVEEKRQKCALVDIQEDQLRAFIGHRGAHIHEFELLHDVKVRSEKKGTPRLRIQGEAPAVAYAKAAVEEWATTHRENGASFGND